MNDKVSFYDSLDSPFVRIYSSRAPLTKRGFEKAQRGDPVFSPVFEQLLGIPGVASIYGTAYEVIVCRGERYMIDEVHPRVLDILLMANAEARSTKDVQ